jgi:photosystem II stability/assembly factor-like uncharacterized protein
VRRTSTWTCLLAACVLSGGSQSAQQREPAGGPPGGSVYRVAVARTSPATLFASPLYGGVFRSVDAGASWQQAASGLPDEGCDLTTDPRLTQVVYAVCDETVFKTTDSGRRWAPLTLPAPAQHDLVIAPSDSNIVYVPGHRCERLYVSRTGGRTWDVVNSRGLPAAGWQALAADAGDAAILYGVCDRRLFKSTDAGASWAPVTGGLPADEEVWSVRVDPLRPGTVYTGPGRRLFKSMSSGSSWKAIGEFPQTIDDVLTGSAAGVIVVRANHQLFQTDDGGRRWTSIRPEPKSTLLWNVVMDPASDATLYAATGAGLFVTTDAGAQWRQTSSLGLLRSRIWSMTVEGDSPATLRVSTDGGAFASVDGGETWRPTTEPATSHEWVDAGWKDARPNGQAPRTLTVVPGDPRRAFASIGETFKPKSLWRTVDGGATWQHADECSPHLLTFACQAIVDPNDSQVIYGITVAESPSAGWESVRRSVDGGACWQPMKTPSQVWLFAVLPTKPRTTIFADLPISSDGGSHTLMVSVDRGDTWIRSDSGLPQSARVTALVMDPSRPSRLFAGTNGRGVFVSDDGGRQWRLAGAALAR